MLSRSGLRPSWEGIGLCSLFDDIFNDTKFDCLCLSYKVKLYPHKGNILEYNGLFIFTRNIFYNFIKLNLELILLVFIYIYIWYLYNL